jgi:hypothetical protein
VGADGAGTSAFSVDEPASEAPSAGAAASPAFAPEPDVAVERRSFLAQPDPLKWIAGAVKALRTGPPPHEGQLVGPSAWTPWMTSNRVPQLAQS